ncbi:glycosyltransferase family 9 protein [Nitrospira moscoviensis]|uniref:Putative Lipopolysaccharide heptosyltransferase II n=1 Tax=Nitrospira moscoviensis TaxID=42253 RepID=A0A0K2GG45_NITMO|nr:glycosyltransferase family 9 protein [Nitrospira moscoviensis]ALA59918.1 putative Lipopolysaccharide heptosyltransferase II [Nitrospira moscoviensis]
MANMPAVQRILLIKPSSLGDIVHTMPVVAAVKQRWPAAHLTWLVKRRWAELVERIEGVDRVWPFDATLGGALRVLPALRSERWDLVLDLQGLFRSAVIGRLSGGGVRVGFANGREGSPWFYTTRVPVPTSEMHAVDRYLLAAEAVGAAPLGEPRFRFKIDEQDQRVVRELLRSRGVQDQSWIAMHVSARWETKRWPLESFAAVADQLTKEGLGPLVVMGGEGERSEVERLKRLVTSSVIDVAGAVPLGYLPAFLSKAAAMITNDSGPMHIAAAVGTPVVALFGPTSVRRTGPYGDQHTVLTHEISCRPCFSRICRNGEPLACLTQITPARVVDAVKIRRRMRGTVALP